MLLIIITNEVDLIIMNKDKAKLQEKLRYRGKL